MDSSCNPGLYLARRLSQLGVGHFFTVPGDFTLSLLDQFLKVPDLKMIGCCNELNAGYAADGYARARGVSALVVTFTVGGLSAINAVAGAYAEDLPLIFISGGPNTNDEPQNHRLHHTLGEADFNHQARMFAEVTAGVWQIRHVEDGPAMIDEALRTAVQKRKPVYIELACNLVTLPCPEPAPAEFVFKPQSDPLALSAAVEAVAARWDRAVKPALVGGVKMRSYGGIESFQTLARAAQCAVAVMPNAKGMFPEEESGFIGTYWGPVSSPGCAEVIESCDLSLFVGGTFTDYTLAGYSALLAPEKMIRIEPDRVILPDATYQHVALADFVSALAARITVKPASLRAYDRVRPDPETPHLFANDVPLNHRILMQQVQAILSDENALIVETGDSWFNGQRLKLPPDCGYEFQMQYGSIGWSVGATLGYALARPEKRLISLIGDGSFQLTAQEVSTMIRYETRPIIFLMNNGGYTIEVEIHDGPYNVIQNWNYAALMAVFNGKGLGLKADTGGELSAAIDRALAHDGPVLIECKLDRDDCSKELLEWGSRVASNNSRPPVR